MSSCRTYTFTSTTTTAYKDTTVTVINDEPRINVTVTRDTIIETKYEYINLSLIDNQLVNIEITPKPFAVDVSIPETTTTIKESKTVIKYNYKYLFYIIILIIVCLIAIRITRL